MERIDSDKVAPKMEDISSPIPLIIDYDFRLQIGFYNSLTHHIGILRGRDGTFCWTSPERKVERETSGEGSRREREDQ